jgi:hypothetical protein
MGDTDEDAGSGYEVQVNQALVDILKSESAIKGGIPDGLLRVGARLSAVELKKAARGWRPMYDALLRAGVWSPAEEAEFIQGMVVKKSRPNTVLHALKILRFFPPNVLGSPQDAVDIETAIEVMDAGRQALEARKEKKRIAERVQAQTAAAGGGGEGTAPLPAQLAAWGASAGSWRPPSTRLRTPRSWRTASTRQRASSTAPSTRRGDGRRWRRRARPRRAVAWQR